MCIFTINSFVFQGYARCPLCRKKVSSENLIECHLEETHDEKNTKQQWASSSKVNSTFYLCVCVYASQKMC